MCNFKKFGVLAVAVFALSAIGANVSAASEFTASATGSLEGKALESQVFTFNGGKVTCSKAATSGTISATAATSQHVTVNYSECTAFGFATVHFSPATYLYTSNGDLHIQNRNNIQETPVIPITITPTFFGSSICTITISTQTLDHFDGNVYFATWGFDMTVEPQIFNINYTSTGGSCGTSGENGTLTGRSALSRVGGGTLAYDF